MQIKHSQNFFTNRSILKKLISECEFQTSDIVIDIGAGSGIISKELVKYSNNVIAVEKDFNLYSQLINEIKNNNIKIVNNDILKFELPLQKFKVFSNIPFNQSTEILHKLITNSYFIEGYLFLQKETFFRFAGDEKKEIYTFQSTISNIDFDVSKIFEFKRTDFNPIPNIDIYLVKLKRKVSEIKNDEKELFIDFVSYVFNNSTPNIEKSNLFTFKQLEIFQKNIKVGKNTIPSNTNFQQYLNMFNVIKNTDKRNIFKNYHNNIKQNQFEVQKHFRTRIDRKWKFK